MLLSWTLSFFLVVVTAESDQVRIENKNININVNINPKELAEELWKIIELHLKHDGNSITRRLMQEDAVNELEEVIQRVIKPTRRLNPIAEVELAKNYERIVRRAIPTFGWDQSSFDPLGNIDDIVDDMMWATKTFINQPSKTLVDKDKPAKIQTSVTDHGEATWSFTLRRIMKSLKNIENTLQNLGQQLAVERMSPNNFADLLSYPANVEIKRLSKARGRPEKHENINNYNVIKSALASKDQQRIDDDELYNYKNDASDIENVVDENLNTPHVAADRGLRRQETHVNNMITVFDPKNQQGMQDVIPKRGIFPSTVSGLQNYLKTRNNLLSWKKPHDNRRPTEYINPDSGKTLHKNKSKNTNTNENKNVINFGKKDNYNGKSKTIRMLNYDNDYEDHI